MQFFSGNLRLGYLAPQAILIRKRKHCNNIINGLKTVMGLNMQL